MTPGDVIVTLSRDRFPTDMRGWLHDQEAVLHEIDEIAAVREAKITAAEAERAIEHARGVRAGAGHK
ncbi:MAG: hypothetical protein KVP17_001238 [Porospora cf. gigantea B]|uniref:uncharacterized protein n=1 Tax=Porospora cf. gigantea B TaxID=2853592 RepID=UPI003571B82D|nr:MAG: hypothetical protein KVP17_001238 [Porospora cf. gigantea B]